MLFMFGGPTHPRNLEVQRRKNFVKGVWTNENSRYSSQIGGVADWLTFASLAKLNCDVLAEIGGLYYAQQHIVVACRVRLDA